VSIDLESGYGDTSELVGQTIRRSIATGAVDCNIENSFPADLKPREIVDQSDRIRHARGAADDGGLRFFINAQHVFSANMASLERFAKTLHLIKGDSNCGNAKPLPREGSPFGIGNGKHPRIRLSNLTKPRFSKTSALGGKYE
jgi:Phosphoenolpyruvate phosphomutase